MSSSRFEYCESPALVEPPEAEYVRLLGFPKGYSLEGRSRELADSARAWFAAHGQPWIYARSASALEVNGKHVRIEEAVFSSARLRARFAAARATQSVLVAVSAGAECEIEATRRWREEKPDEYFFLEAYGSAVVESLVARIAGRICAWADQFAMAALPHFSPGYNGWPVAEQSRLWGLIRQENSTALRDRLEVMESGMLRPKKSLLAVVGLTPERDRISENALSIPCVHCFLADCSFRRAPYRNVVRQSTRFARS